MMNSCNSSTEAINKDGGGMGVVSTSSGSAHPPKVWEYNLLLEGKGRSLEEMLFESGITPVTKEGYRMQWEPFMSYLASKYWCAALRQHTSRGGTGTTSSFLGPVIGT